MLKGMFNRDNNVVENHSLKISRLVQPKQLARQFVSFRKRMIMAGIRHIDLIMRFDIIRQMLSDEFLRAKFITDHRIAALNK